MKKAKKKNNVIQLRESELKKIKKDITIEATNAALTIFINVMRDYEGWGTKRLKRLFAEITDLSDSIARGYCNIYDLEKVLYDEAGIVVSGGKFDKPKYTEGLKEGAE